MTLGTAARSVRLNPRVCRREVWYNADAVMFGKQDAVEIVSVGNGIRLYLLGIL